MTSEQFVPTTHSQLQASYLKLLNQGELWQDTADHGISAVLEECALNLQVARVGLWRFNANGDAISCRQLFRDNSIALEPQIELFAKDHPLYFKAICEQQLVVANQAQQDAITQSFCQQYLKPLNITAMLDARIMLRGLAYGLICAEHIATERMWTADEQTYINQLSSIIAQLLIAEQLQQSDERFRKIFDSADSAMVLMHRSQIVDCNPKALALFACSKDDMTRHPPDRFWAEVQADGSLSKLKAQHYFKTIEAGQKYRFEWRQRRWDGSEFDGDVELSGINLQGLPHILASITDKSLQQQKEQQFYQVFALQQALFNSAQQAIFATNTDGIIQNINSAALELLGYDKQELLAGANATLFHDVEELKWRAIELSDELDSLIEPDFTVLSILARSEGSEKREWTLLAKDQRRIPVQLSFTALYDTEEARLAQTPSGFLAMASDISESKRTSEQLLNSKKEMEFRANHDDLTGLPNRMRLHDITQTAIKLARSKGHGLALLLLDLNRFKEVNDTLGHALGDQLLKRIAQRLNTMLERQGARLFRLGGDEFSILMPYAIDLNDTLALAKKVHDCLRQPIEIKDITLELSGSVGISMYPAHGDNSHALLRCADVAMYKAKTESAGTIFYQAEQDAHSPRRLRMMAELGTAIREDQLLLHYQPKISLAQQRCVGAEALVRWQHPRLGMVPPGEFIPLAEMSDTIQPLGLWVLDKALHQLKIWQYKNIEIDVSINLSARNLMDSTFPKHIERLLKFHQVPAHLLEIEITESTLIGDPERALSTLNAIHRLGVRFAIDDFGTGYSSLSYLKRLPIDTLKIDRSFVRDMLTDEQDAVIVRSTLGLAHSFGLDVVAEGVEDESTLVALKDLCCEQAQGFLISKPVPADIFETWLADYNAQA